MSELQKLGRRLDGLRNLIKTQHPQDEWILVRVIPLFVKGIQSSTTDQEESTMIGSINDLIDTYNWRFGSNLESVAYKS